MTVIPISLRYSLCNDCIPLNLRYILHEMTVIPFNLRYIPYEMIVMQWIGFTHMAKYSLLKTKILHAIIVIPLNLRYIAYDNYDMTVILLSYIYRL